MYVRRFYTRIRARVDHYFSEGIKDDAVCSLPLSPAIIQHVFKESGE
jgi:hypothetical protein